MRRQISLTLKFRLRYLGILLPARMRVRLPRNLEIARNNLLLSCCAIFFHRGVTQLTLLFENQAKRGNGAREEAIASYGTKSGENCRAWPK